MKADAVNFLAFLNKSPQFSIPIYQRTYSWSERECRQLWDDIIRTGKDDDIAGHFIGSIVFVESGLYTVMNQEPLLVIDGQQRLTTITLLLAALARVVAGLPEDDPERKSDFSHKKIHNYYLCNPDEEGERKYKLVLSQTDRDTLIAIVGGNQLPKDPSLQVVKNSEMFDGWIAGLGENRMYLCRGLAKLLVVSISLDRSKDNPQLIFESMNSTGRELGQADLIRNFLLMGLKPSLQSHLYAHYWRPMETDFGQDAYIAHFDKFIRHYLTIKTGEIPNVNRVYDAFKDYARSSEIVSAGTETLVSDIRTCSKYYCSMALGAEPDNDLKEAYQDLRELRVDVAYPLLLELHHDYATGLLHKNDLLAALRLIEAYVFRRFICSIPTNSLNKTFATFNKSINKGKYFECIQAAFLVLPSYRRFPTDEEFRRNLLARDLYNTPRHSYILRRLENHGRKERVSLSEYTTEHILPENPSLSSAWKAELGLEWERIRETWLHTLGNLTLTGYNSEYSDRPFKDKRDMKGGFRESPIKLNEGLGKLEQWNEDAIKGRANRLATLAIQVWPAPALPEAVFATYAPPKNIHTVYSIVDHPHLAGAMKPIFEAFSKAVLALDPCVTEEFLKLYVAYKAETNFVDVIPQAKRLLLSLNISPADLQDSKGLIRDVSHLHRWGNGDTEVGLSKLDELPYIMSLVRQAFEKQMGTTEE